MSTTPIFVTQSSLPPLEEFMPYLQKIWDSKMLTNCGPMHQKLEASLCDHLGVQEIALFNNGTIGLMTALQTLALTGDVITTPYSFIATTHALIWNNLKPVFVDVDPLTLNIDPQKIEEAITPKTCAILAVHCYGHPCDVEAIHKIAQKHNLKVIYDAAHAFGVKIRDGKSVLNSGDLSVLSFHATKVFNTFEGGAIVCHDEATKDRITRLKNFGIVDETTIDEVGLNGKMSEINAAFGLLQLQHLDNELAGRKIVDQRYRDILKDIPGVVCLGDAGEETSNYAYFPILVDEDYALSRDDLYTYLKQHNIYARRYFYPLISSFSMYKDLPSSRSENLPIATRAAEQVLCLPLYPTLSADDQQRISSLIRNAH